MKKFTKKLLIDEVKKAKTFKLRLDHFIIVTTAPHDVEIVTEAAILSEQNGKEEIFSVEVFGWEELQRMAELHPDVISHFYREFFRSNISAPDQIKLTIEPDLSIAMNDCELALFCSEAAAKITNHNSTLIEVIFGEEIQLRQEIAFLDAEKAPTTEQRMHRSNLVAYLERIAPRLRQLESAVPILLTDANVRSPWLIGPDWTKTAIVLRALIGEIVKPATHSRPDKMQLKIRSPRNSAIVTYLDLDEREQKDFRARNPNYTPFYFLGSVFDLGNDLGLRAMAAGIAAVFRYSSQHNVPLDQLRADGELSVYQWSVEAA